MMSTFGGSLEARQIDASNGKLIAQVVGEVEAEEGVLVIRRIHVEAIQVLGDVVNAFACDAVRGGVGFVVAGALLFYLLRPEVRSAFASSNEPSLR
jgi:hypothetical protein